MFDKIDTHVILGRENRLYFSKFDTSFGCVILNAKENIFITDSRYALEASNRLTNFNLQITGGAGFYQMIADNLKRLGAKTVGFEDDVLTVLEHKTLKTALEGFSLKASGKLYKEMRQIKTELEIENIQQAQIIAQKSLNKICSMIKAGVTEKELEAELTYETIKNGSEGMAFDAIISFGKNAAKPHHRPGDKKLEKGESIMFDFGVKYKGYCSDMTRTFCLGEPPKQLVKIHSVVLEAQKYALANIKAGMTGHEADSLAREYINSNGFEKEFSHSLGHGVGIFIHENPRLSKNSTDILLPGMVVTVEPGIYIEDFGGVRIEDMIVITENGNKNLTSFDKDLHI